MARILVVEDDQDVREACMRHLVQDGHQVEAVATGEEALSLVATHEFDLLIVDLLLPGMDGAELCRIIRTGHEKPALPIMMVTSMGYRMGIQVTAADAHWAPVDCCVDKSTPLNELSKMATELLAHHSAPAGACLMQTDESTGERDPGRVRGPHDDV